MQFHQILDELRVKHDRSGRGKNRPGWTNIKCPFCGRDPYLGIPDNGRVASCWNCGIKSLYEVLIALWATPKEAQAFLNELPSYKPTQRQKHKGRLILPQGIETLLVAHKFYLRNRGFSPSTLQKLWNIQGIGPLGGYLSWRLFIPVIQNGEVVSWTTRRLDNKEPRYHDAKPEQSTVPIKSTLYGLDYVRSTALLVEGCPDCWAGGPGFVGSFGLRLSDSQSAAFCRLPLRIVLFNSGPMERAAQARARRICRQLACYEGKTIRVTLDSAKDVASADPAEIQELRRKYLESW